jgi:hypothetical protein
MRLLPLLPLLVLTGCDNGENLGQPPVAVLKSPKHCDLGAVISLDGSESSDPDDDIVLYRFIITDGTVVREVAGPRVDHTCNVEGLIEVALEVHDAKGNVRQARVVVSVRPP